MSGSVPGEILVDVRDLRKHFLSAKALFGRRQSVVRAVDGVSFQIRRGETLALVGESGSGKTTAGRCLLRLTEPTSGSIHYNRVNLLSLSPPELRRMRRKMQIVFQDPFSSLNPRVRVGAAIAEGMLIHEIAEGAAADGRVAALLEEVGLRPEYAHRYPHEFSGGQRQRIGIARALSVEPEFIVCDEPVSALDVSVQAQVINLLMALQQRRGLTYLFIAHDLSVVRHMADEVAVMYLGRIVEKCGAEELFRRPLMPYTQALLSAVPVPDPDAPRTRIVLSGDIPSPAAPPSGCVFHPRCPHPARDAACSGIAPPLEDKGDGHLAACLKQPPTTVGWDEQRASGAKTEPTLYIPLAGDLGSPPSASTNL